MSTFDLKKVLFQFYQEVVPGVCKFYHVYTLARNKEVCYLTFNAHFTQAVDF